MKVMKYPAKEEWGKLVERPHLDVSQLRLSVSLVLSLLSVHSTPVVLRLTLLPMLRLRRRTSLVSSLMS